MVFTGFQKSPTELIQYIKDKKPELHYNYDELMHEAHHRTFTVAKITRLDLLKDIQDSLANAMNKGVGFEEWKKNIVPTLKEKGWYGKVESISPAGEIKDIYVGSRRLKTIFDTNMRVAYNRGRYQSQMESLGEYFYYSAIMDSDTRPTHAKLHGTILPKTHPFWDTHYPPNDWNCRCTVRVYTKKQLENRGLTPSFFTPPNIAHKDWAYNVGKNDNIKQVYKDKVDLLPNGSFLNTVKKTLNEDLTYLKQNDKLYSEVQTLFTTNKPKKVELTKTDIFGTSKKVLLSSDTVQGHLDREEITAYDYALIPEMLQGEKRVFKQKENVFVLLKKLGKNYRLALKNISNSDEIYATSLLFVKDFEKEIKKLLKFEEIEE